MKRRLRQMLAEGRFDAVTAEATGATRVLGLLVTLTFDPDPAIAWRAVEAMGRAAAAIADRDPAPVRDHLRRLVWLLSEESGGICWRAPEALAEIVRRRPAPFADFIPIVVHLLTETAEEDLAHFRPGMLWAIGRLGPVAAGRVVEVLPAITAALEHPDPRCRGMAAWTLGQIGRGDLLAERPALATDDAELAVYEDGHVRSTTVAALTRAARDSAPAPD
jgi:hypothetical protein